MKRVLLLAFLVLAASGFVFSQTKTSKITLTRLGVSDPSMEKVLADISEYIRSKPQGLRFPISKILFTKVKGGISYEIKGVDNTWAGLFNYGESTYGYTVVAGRLYVIMGIAEEEPDLNPFFYLMEGSRSFSRNILPPTGLLKTPIWVYDHIDGESVKVLEKDLEILEK